MTAPSEQSDRPHWEGALQSDRDDMLNRVDAFLRGQPYPPASIRPSDQCKARILAGIIGAFVLGVQSADCSSATARRRCSAAASDSGREV